MAGFMKKEELEAEAERLGVDLEGLTWPQKQKAVIQAQKEEAEAKPEAEAEKPVEEKPKAVVEEQKPCVFLDPDPSRRASGERKEKSIIDEYRGKTIVMSPEIAPTNIQLIKYDEELEEDEIVEEVHYEPLDGSIKAGNMAIGTYRKMGSTGRKVIAQSTIPKQNSRITFRPDVDMFPVDTFNGRTGYIWTHHRLPNVKEALMQSGYYHEYANRFKDEPAIWYSAGKLLVCDINLVHSIFKEIERKEHQRRNSGI